MRPETTADGGWRVVLTQREADLVMRAVNADVSGALAYSNDSSVEQPESSTLVIVGPRDEEAPFEATAAKKHSCLWPLLTDESFYDPHAAYNVGRVLRSAAISSYYGISPAEKYEARTILCAIADALCGRLLPDAAPLAEQPWVTNRITKAEAGGIKVGFHDDEADIVRRVLGMHLDKLHARKGKVRGLREGERKNETAYLTTFLYSGMCRYADPEATRDGEGVSPLQLYAAASVLRNYARRRGMDRNYPPYHDWMVPLTTAMIKYAQAANPEVKEQLRQAYALDGKTF